MDIYYLFRSDFLDQMAFHFHHCNVAWRVRHIAHIVQKNTIRYFGKLTRFCFKINALSLLLFHAAIYNKLDGITSYSYCIVRYKAKFQPARMQRTAHNLDRNFQYYHEHKWKSLQHFSVQAKRNPMKKLEKVHKAKHSQVDKKCDYHRPYIRVQSSVL